MQYANYASLLFLLAISNTVLQGQTTMPLAHTGELLTCAAPNLAQDKNSQGHTILKHIQETQRAGFERHDFAKYMSLWSKDVKITLGRSEKPGKYDTHMDHKRIAKTAKLKYHGKPGVKIRFANAVVKVNRNLATVRYRSFATTGETTGIVDEVYRLRKVNGVWKAYENRAWPVETKEGKETTRYTAEAWKQLDANVEMAQKNGDRSKIVESLFKAWRFNEAYTTSKKWTKESPKQALAWYYRGHAALVIRDADDAVRSLRRANALDPQFELPDYIQNAGSK